MSIRIASSNSPKNSERSAAPNQRGQASLFILVLGMAMLVLVIEHQDRAVSGFAREIWDLS